MQSAFSSLDIPPPTLTAYDVAVVDSIVVAPFAVAVTFIVAITARDQAHLRTHPVLMPARIPQFARTIHLLQM